MNKELLNKHIKTFIEKLNSDKQKADSDYQERIERIEYYQSWDSKRISKMTEEDIYDYLSKLWAMRIWGNKQYIFCNE